jgi:hypothetical protein
MKITACIAEKEGVTFAVAQMDISMVDMPGRARDMIASLKEIFPDKPAVLMTRDKRGTPIFYGRPDIVNGLGDAVLQDVEWREYTLE